MSVSGIQVFIADKELDEWEVVLLFKDYFHNSKKSELIGVLDYCDCHHYSNRSFTRYVLEIFSLEFFPCRKQWWMFEGQRLLCMKFKLSSLLIFFKKFCLVQELDNSSLVERMKSLEGIILRSFFKNKNYCYIVFIAEFLEELRGLEIKTKSNKTISMLNPLTMKELSTLAVGGFRLV